MLTLTLKGRVTVTNSGSEDQVTSREQNVFLNIYFCVMKQNVYQDEQQSQLLSACLVKY